MGGAVGLKGSDGLVAHARELGAQEVAAQRAVRALEALREIAKGIEILTAGNSMGETALQTSRLDHEVVFRPTNQETSAEDTQRAAATMVERGIDLLLFAGGDGTARDVLQAVGDRIPVLGIPAGVKMHSAVFAITARHAGDVARRFLSGDSSIVVESAEVMDRENVGSGPASPRLYGFVRTPRAPLLVQHAKMAMRSSDEADLEAACAHITNLARDDTLSIIGPGTTTRMIKRRLGFEGTLDGVDLVAEGRLLASDCGEQQILEAMNGRRARIIVGVIGGQGYLFGRGNQQISADVIRRVGRENIVVLASRSKLLSLSDGCLFVDTGDSELDQMLAGYIPVHTGPGQRMMFRIAG